MTEAQEIGTVELTADVAFSVQVPGDGAHYAIDLFYIVDNHAEVIGFTRDKAAQLRDLLTAAIDSVPADDTSRPALPVGADGLPVSSAPPFNLSVEPIWVFSFGSGQRYDGRFVVIQGTYNGAREVMLAHFGNRWSFQYPADSEGAAQIRAEGTLLRREEWPPHKPTEPAEAV